MIKFSHAYFSWSTEIKTEAEKGFLLLNFEFKLNSDCKQYFKFADMLLFEDSRLLLQAVVRCFLQMCY